MKFPNIVILLLVAVMTIKDARSAPAVSFQNGNFVAGEPLTKDEFNSNILMKGKNNYGSSSHQPRMDFFNWNKNVKNLVGGDMVVSEDMKTVSPTANKWPNAEVFYVISAGYTSEERQIIAAAMNAFQTTTCIRFIPRNTETDYIEITKTGTSCTSFVGRIGGAQAIELSAGCLSTSWPGIPMHELMHALGFIHEQQRPDQELYVNVFYDNIQPEQHIWFQPLSANDVNTLGFSYDTNSVMHYLSYSSAAIDVSKPVMLAKDGSLVGNDQYLSTLDIQKINKYYGCPARG